MAPWMALFPPGKGGGEGVARGGKGKGILIHSLTEGGALLNERAWTGSAPDGSSCFRGNSGKGS